MNFFFCILEAVLILLADYLFSSSLVSVSCKTSMVRPTGLGSKFVDRRFQWVFIVTAGGSNLMILHVDNFNTRL